MDVDARVNWSARWLRPRGRASMTSLANTRKSERQVVNVEALVIEDHAVPSADLPSPLRTFSGHGHGHAYGREI